MSWSAILFDLDDTLFDHQHARRGGLRCCQERYAALAGRALAELELVHEEILVETHHRLLAGRLTLEEARRERTERFFRHFGLTLPEAEVAEAVREYRAAYQAARRPVPGALELLAHLRGRVPLGLVTNGLVGEQTGKIDFLGLEGWFDTVAISEAAGCRKPDPAIFHLALAALGAPAGRSLMVGDSWANDVLGATGAGLSALWLNRYEWPHPDPSRARALTALQPFEVVRPLFGY